ncbi:MAG: DUF3786 domain-containing protein [Candidatus Lindowbacteria bacterium]|nr:DUF3786 domain-containing protein [Candidatus Lindowbacteria bacterium]
MSEDTFFENDDKIDRMYWEELKSMDPAGVCRRSLARYNESEKSYELRVLNDDLLIYADKKRIKRVSEPASKNDGPPGFNAVLVSVHYLIRAKEIPIACEYVTETQVTDGSFFFKGPHALPSWKIERRFGNDARAFLEKGKLIGGNPVRFGDTALEFLVLPRIRIAYVLWTADEEFPARSQILFDASADKHFALDVVWAMCNMVTNKLLNV